MWSGGQNLLIRDLIFLSEGGGESKAGESAEIIQHIKQDVDLPFCTSKEGV